MSLNYLARRLLLCQHHPEKKGDLKLDHRVRTKGEKCCSHTTDQTSGDSKRQVRRVSITWQEVRERTAARLDRHRVGVTVGETQVWSQSCTTWLIWGTQGTDSDRGLKVGVHTRSSLLPWHRRCTADSHSCSCCCYWGCRSLSAATRHFRDEWRTPPSERQAGRHIERRVNALLFHLYSWNNALVVSGARHSLVVNF